MKIIVTTQTSETLVSVVVETYPAGTAITGSPFSGASLTNVGNGLWTVDIGSVTGEWYVAGFNVDGNPNGQIVYGYATSDIVDGNGNATAMDNPPWLAPTVATITALQASITQLINARGAKAV